MKMKASQSPNHKIRIKHQEKKVKRNQKVKKVLMKLFKIKENTPKKARETEEVENNPKLSNQPSRKGIPMVIDQASYKIMDIFKYNNDLSNQGLYFMPVRSH